MIIYFEYTQVFSIILTKKKKKKKKTKQNKNKTKQRQTNKKPDVGE